MAPTLARPPFHRDGWIYEEKVDGWRMISYRAKDIVPHVYMQNGPLISVPEISRSARSLPLENERTY
jgi:hypothetical protein